MDTLSPIHISPLRPLTFTMRDASGKLMGEGREAGLHLSEIVRAIKAASGEKVDGMAGEDENVRPQEGFWWEAALEYAFKTFMGKERPDIRWQVKLEHDGINSTPDGYHADDQVLVSAKHTARSMRKWEADTEAVNSGAHAEHFWPWFMHDMGCLKMWNAQSDQRLYTMRYFIHWSHGDWSRDFKKNTGRPQPTTCDVTFSDEAIERNWQLMLLWKERVLNDKAKAIDAAAGVAEAG